jgi:hypothetical protein
MTDSNATAPTKTLTTYRGGCHCGAVRYEVDATLERVVECNCSMCARAGTLLFFVDPANFRLLSGEDALTDYQFAKKRIHHLFCKHCGVRSFARGSEAVGGKIAVNARCLDDVDLGGIARMQFDGKSI